MRAKLFQSRDDPDIDLLTMLFPIDVLLEKTTANVVAVSR